MRSHILLLIAFFIYLSVHAQDDRTRTRVVDLAEFDRLYNSVYTAADRRATAIALLAVVDKHFTPEDEEYYNAHIAVGATYEFLMDPVTALQHYQKAVEAYEKHYPFYHRGYASVTPDLGLYSYIYLSKAYRALNLNDKATQLMEQKQHLLSEHPALYLRQEFFSQYGQALLGAGNYPKAIELGNKLRELTASGALKQSFPAADDIYKIDTTWDAAVQDQMKKAKELYKKTVALGEEMSALSQRSGYLMLLSLAHYYQYQYAEATPLLKDMLEVNRRVIDLSLENMRATQAYAASTTGSVQSQEVLSFYAKFDQLGGQAAALVVAAAKSGQPETAEKYALGALEKALMHQLAGRYDLAEPQWQASFRIMNEFAQFNFAANVGETMRKQFAPMYVNMLVKSGRYEQAITEMSRVLQGEETMLNRSFQFFTEAEKKEFFTGFNEKIEKYLSLLLEMNEKNLDQAERIVDKVLQTKGLILDVTREQERRLKRSNDKQVIEQIRTIRKLRARLAAFYQINVKSPTAALGDSISRYAVVISDLERKVNEKLGAGEVLKPATWKSIQAKLKKDEVYLEIVRLKRDNFAFDKPMVQYWAFAITSDGTKPVLFKVSEGEAFEGRGFNNYQNRIKLKLDDPDSYKTYWATIGERLGGKSKLFFSSDGVYHMINPLTFKNSATGQFLLNEISLTRVSTGRDFANAVAGVTVNKEIALIGNPAFEMSRKSQPNFFAGREFEAVEATSPGTRSGFARLPGTQKEVESIEALAKANGIKTTVLAGNSATESQVKALQSPHVLHVATHGEFDNAVKADSYLRSKLILAGAADPTPFTVSDFSKYEDGFLTAYEVTQLELSNTNLVILSACETGVGEVQSGEGVWGLQRAFQLAGAKTVMGSLWKISDEATVTFMEGFYRRYLGGADISSAYREALETTRAAYPHPYYWGAFILTGASR